MSLGSIKGSISPTTQCIKPDAKPKKGISNIFFGFD